VGLGFGLGWCCCWSGVEGRDLIVVGRGESRGGGFDGWCWLGLAGRRGDEGGVGLVDGAGGIG